MFRQWRADPGASSKTELDAVVRAAHSIGDAHRAEQAGQQRKAI